MNEKIYFHIDVNSAFLSWTAVELLKEDSSLDIRTIASAIAGDPTNRTGIILAKSLPAKKFNIITGETNSSALKKCPQLKLYPPNYKNYVLQSRAMGQILENYSPDIEQYSIDEYFIEYVPLLGTYMEVAKKIQNDIYNTLGFTVNIGISTNKILAKMASDFEKPNKIHTLFLSEIETKMWPLPIEELFMCGKASSTKLRMLGIDTIGKLAHSNIELLRFHLKSKADMLVSFANGTYVSSIKSKEHNKCFSNSITTKTDLDNLEDINAVLLSVSEYVSKRLRKEGFKAKTIAVDYKLNTFQSYSHCKSFNIPISTTKEIYDIAIKLFEESWNKVPVRLLGISLTHLENEENLQTDLFNMDNIKQDSLDCTIDKINSTLKGNIKIGRASALFSENKCRKNN